MYNKKDKNSIKILFNDIAKRYDVLNNIISLGFHKTIKLKSIRNVWNFNKSPKRILDLCTGTGDMAKYSANIFPDSEIIGLDFSEKMIEIAKKKCEKYRNIQLIKYDVTDLKNLNLGQFDIVFIGFGLRNLPDVETFLDSIKFVLKEGGILSILDLGKIQGITGFFYNIYLEKILPVFGKTILNNFFPLRYLEQSLKEYPSQKEMIDFLQKYGFSNVKNYDFILGAIAQQIGILNRNVIL